MSSPRRADEPAAPDAAESSAALGVATELGIAPPQAGRSRAVRALARWLVLAAVVAAAVTVVLYIALMR